MTPIEILLIIGGATITTLSGTTTFFLRRSIKFNDKHHDQFYAKISAVKDDIKEIQEKHYENISRLEQRMNDKLDGIETNLYKYINSKFEEMTVIRASINELNVKQERLNIISEKMDGVQKNVSRFSDSILVVQEEVTKTNKEVARLWDYVRRLDLKVVGVDTKTKIYQEPDITHILQSPYLQNDEKRAIISYKKKLMETEPYKIEEFVKYLENKIQKIEIEKIKNPDMETRKTEIKEPNKTIIKEDVRLPEEIIKKEIKEKEEKDLEMRDIKPKWRISNSLIYDSEFKKKDEKKEKK